MRILIVDDSKVMRSLVARGLKAAGQTDTAEAESGVDALAKLRAERFDFVLSDWNMPQMDGLGLLAAMKDHGIDVPVAFITSECTQQSMDHALSCGVRFVLNKPFTPDALSKALNAAVGARAA